MTKENRPHEGAGTRSGGPADESTAPTPQVSDDARYVRITSLEYVELMHDAGLWRLLRTSPHVAELLDEWAEWDRRRLLRESSWGVSAVSRSSWRSPSYAELERRRNRVDIPGWAVEANAKLARKRREAA